MNDHRIWSLLAAILGICFLSPALFAQPTGPYLVKNILDQPITPPLSSTPLGYRSLGDISVFRPVGLPWQIWSTDGTEEGTQAIREFCPNAFCNSAQGYSLSHFGTAGGYQYFLFGIPLTQSLFGPVEWELWKTDGTSPGTVLLATELSLDNPFAHFIFAAPPLGSIEPDGILIFSAETADSGYELWATDGSPGGTGMLGDLTPGPEGSSLGSGSSVNNRVLFTVFKPGISHDLWTTDGTEAGTQLMASFSFARRLFASGDFVFYLGDDEIHGSELWRTDGTAAGTQLITELGLGTAGIDGILTPTGGRGDRYFFVAEVDGQNAQLFVTDGTELGTRQLTQFASAGAFPSFIVQEEIAQTEQAFFFVADDGLSGRELWTSDGTVLGTRRVADVCPGPCSSEPLWMRPVAGGVLFQANDGTHGIEPWFSDGTSLGTRMAGDLCPGVCGSAPNLRPHMGDPGFFTAEAGDGRELWFSEGSPAGALRLTDLPGANPFGSTSAVAINGRAGGLEMIAIDDGVNGKELWQSDGTPAGTHLLKDLRPSGDYQSVPREIVPLSSGIAFVAWDEQGDAQLYVSDGTEAGTELLPLPNAFATPNPRHLASAGDQVFFYAADAASETQLWVSSGNPAGTMSLTDIVGLLAFPDEIGILNGEAYFSVVVDMWKSNGTPEGTNSLAPVTAQPTTPAGGRYLEHQGRLYFAGDDPGNPNQGFKVLWRTDGSAGGTLPVPSAAGTVFRASPHLTAVGSFLYFMVDVGADQYELWRTDGDQLTERVALLPAFPPDSRPILLGAAGPRLLLAAFGEDHGKELWVSDGTAAGTRRLRDISPGAGSSFSPETTPQVAALRGSLVFAANDGTRGEELWISDGTEAGTDLLREIGPGLAGAYLRNLISTGEFLFFAASDGLHGLELWQSDGSPLGTFRLTDIRPGPQSSEINRLNHTEDLLFFRASTDATNLELWALPLGTAASALIFADGFESGDLVNWSGSP